MDGGLEIMRTTRVTVHPAWDADHIDGGNDVAILELNASSRHPPVQLPLLRLDIQPDTELTGVFQFIALKAMIIIGISNPPKSNNGPVFCMSAPHGTICQPR